MKRIKNVGGQAVLEGVMMRGPSAYSVAVRKPDGTIVTKTEKTGRVLRSRPFKVFPLRGIGALIDTFAIGMKALSFSAKEAGGEEEEEAMGTKEFALSLVFAAVFVIIFFIALPVFISSLIKGYVGQSYLRSLLEGLIRITIFVTYIAVIGRMRDIMRVFQYHGAEHKVIHTYEADREVTPDNAMGYSPLHVGCGTAYLMMVMIIAIFIFSFIPRTSIPLRMLIQLILIPVIAAFSYEVTRLSRRFENSIIIRVLMAPGLLLQKLTAREPDKEQLEVAVTALNTLLEVETDVKEIRQDREKI